MSSYPWQCQEHGYKYTVTGASQCWLCDAKGNAQAYVFALEGVLAVARRVHGSRIEPDIVLDLIAAIRAFDKVESS